nr:hypothetical protein [Tanacetum cinerariifolium]
TSAAELPAVRQAQFKKDTFSLHQYGAVADGQTLNTNAFQKAISACAAKGGGTVLVPAGLWLTGPIVLQSNVNLHLANGALVQFTPDRSQYPLIKTTWEGEDAVRSQAPISGVDLQNIGITGNGTFDGNGDAWRPVKKSKLNDTEWKKLVASGGVLNDKKDYWYPSAGSLKVESCTFDVGDDGICIKSGRDEEGRKRGAILFDMYYMAKDPVPLAGESTAPPVIEAQPLGEGTPQFKGFYIKNVVCKGAETGILVRGLPEMSIKDISLEN